MTDAVDPEIALRHLRVTLGRSGMTFAVFLARGVWAARVSAEEVVTATYQPGVALTDATPQKRVLLRSLSHASAEQWRAFLRTTFPEARQS